MAESKRDRVKDILTDHLMGTMGRDQAYEEACDVADTIFETLDISPEEQDKP